MIVIHLKYSHFVEIDEYYVRCFCGQFSVMLGRALKSINEIAPSYISELCVPESKVIPGDLRQSTHRKATLSAIVRLIEPERKLNTKF